MNKVVKIYDGGGYLVSGELSRGDAIHAVMHSDIRDEYGNAPSLSLLMEHDYMPGWYRWNPAPRGSDYTHQIEDGTPGQPGSFKAVYLMRRF